MMRIAPRDIGVRSYHSTNRGTVRKANDEPLMNEVHADFMKDDSRQKIERPQNYGFTSNLLPAEEGSSEAPEAFFMQHSGNRAHPVAAVVDDRRHRPNNLKAGESAQYDDQGQQVYLGRDRIVINSSKEVHVQVDKAHVLLTPSKLKVQFNDLSITIKGGKIYIGKEDFINPVITEAGPSELVHCVVAEKDTPMAAAATAKRTKKQQQQTT